MLTSSGGSAGRRSDDPEGRGGAGRKGGAVCTPVAVHHVVQQRLTQCHKVIILLFKKNAGKPNNLFSYLKNIMKT